MMPKAKAIKVQINKWLHQTKKLLYSEGGYQHNEKAASCVGEIFANNVSDNGLIANIQ